ncbi:MAG TPA: hypothetical protein VFQ44_25930 [Streptosporangiaceae bacterium]|nr:hypothetical protein [Streptosporangiaceae bacterium]
MAKTDGASSETIEFGGSPRWLGRLAGSRGSRGATVEYAVIALAVGVAIGFAGGRVTAGHHQSRSGHPDHSLAGAGSRAPGSPAIMFTGKRCASQVGPDLQVGIEIQNGSASPVRIGAVTPLLALGGMRAVSGGVGTCGALPGTAASAPALGPGATAWVTITAAVRVRCPEPLPVGFRIGYTTAGKRATAKIDAFPDLGAVAYRHCGREGQGGS